MEAPNIEQLATEEDALRYLQQRRMHRHTESLYMARRKVLQAAQQHGWIRVVVAVQRAESADKELAGT
jgi:hypothetical protein